MTNQTTADLIGEAITRAELCAADSREAMRDTGGIILRLVDALEAVELERNNWKLSAEEAERAEKRWERRVRVVEQERDQYAAVVEKAEDFVTRHYLDTMFGDEVLPILAAPADALREHDARVWDEGFEAGWAEKEDPGAFVNDVWDAKTPNPYREGQK